MALAHRLIRDYIAIRPEVLEQAAGVISAKFATAMVGVHIRGTDKGAWGGARKVNRIVWPEEFATAVDAALEVLRCGVEDGATEARLRQEAEQEEEEEREQEEEQQQGEKCARRWGGCEKSRRRQQGACRRARRRGIYVATDQAAFRDFFAERFGAHSAAPAHGDGSGGGSVRVAWSGAELSNSSTGIFNLPSPANDDLDARAPGAADSVRRESGGAAASAARSSERGAAGTGSGQGTGAGSGWRAAGSGRGYRRGLEVLVDSLVLSQVSVSSLSRTVRTCVRACVGGRVCVLALIMDTKAQLRVSLHAVGGRRASSSRRRARPLPPTPPSGTPRSPC